MNNSTLTVATFIILACLLWMDTCLYFNIQWQNDKDQFSSNDSNQEQGQPSSTNVPHFLDNISTPFNFMNKFSFAFQGMSVKLMMTDPVDNYILAPLSEALVETINMKDNLFFITPNLVSYAGVASAVVAGYLVSHDSSTLHKLSYVMFQLRTWLDDLDGDVARARMGIHKHESLQKTPGYVIDGVCDAIGFIAYIIGCYVFLKKTIRKSRHTRPVNRYNLKSITEVKSSGPSTYIPLQDCEDTDCLNDPYLSHHAANPQDSDVEFNSVDEDEEEVHFNTVEEYDFPRPNQNKAMIAGEIKSQRRNDFARSKIYLKRKIQNGKQSSVIFYRYIKEKIKDNLSNRKLVIVTLCFLIQLAMCAAFWNRYILVYKDLLESHSRDPAQTRAKSKIMKSNIMYIIIWFWRLTNGHSLMQMLITSVFIGKLWQFLDFIKYIGFIQIIILATITELHVIDVRNFLDAK